MSDDDTVVFASGAIVDELCELRRMTEQITAQLAVLVVRNGGPIRFTLAELGGDGRPGEDVLSSAMVEPGIVELSLITPAEAAILQAGWRAPTGGRES